MFFEKMDHQTVVDYLVKNVKLIRNLPEIKLLKKQLKENLKTNNSALHDDILTEFYKCIRIPIAENVSRGTGLSTEGTLYMLDCIGIEGLKKYLAGRVRVIK